MIRLVLDTNISVSGLLARDGNETRVLNMVRDGRLRPLLSVDIIREDRLVLSRAKFSQYQAEADTLLRVLDMVGGRVETRRAAMSSPDPNDTPFIECAIWGLADLQVTGNKRHFPEPFYGSAAVINTRGLPGYLQASP